MVLGSFSNGLVHSISSELLICQGPSAPWPAFARRERKKKPAIPVGMTKQEKENPRAQPAMTMPQGLALKDLDGAVGEGFGVGGGG